MTPDRYANDYKLTETVDEKGQSEFSYTYAGPVYSLRKDTGKSRQILICTIAGWICFLAALIPNSVAMRVFYISLPFVFAVLPLWFLARTGIFLIRELRGNDRSFSMKRKEADLINNTFPAAAFFCIVLPGISLIGQIVSLARGRWVIPGDVIFTICAAALAGLGIFLFRHRPEAVKSV